MAFSGSCHCGALHFDCDVDPTEVTVCNCTICRRKGAVLHFVDPSEIRLTADPQSLGVYRFYKHIIAHHFCRSCGISVWATVQQPGGSLRIAINLRGSDVDFAALPVNTFDGASM